jgi:hypothetical protein
MDQGHPEWTVTAQLPSGFEDRLLATLDAHGLGELDPDDPRFRANPSALWSRTRRWLATQFDSLN